MFAALIIVSTLLSPSNWSPETVAYMAAIEAGVPGLAPKLVAICERESRCTSVGVHEIDAHLSRRGWRSQVRLGHLDPECQPYEPGQWATRGAWGLSAASHWQYMPECYQPRELDEPMVSARIAVRKYQARCRKKNRPGWCSAKRGSFSSQHAALAEFGLRLLEPVDASVRVW
jgi:hypothetical protein